MTPYYDYMLFVFSGRKNIEIFKRVKTKKLNGKHINITYLDVYSIEYVENVYGRKKGNNRLFCMCI